MSPDPTRRVSDAVRNQWRQLGPPEKLLAGVGLALIAAGLLHVGVWVTQGGTLSGPISWRKPIVFPAALGAIQVCTAWVARHLKMRSWIAWITMGGLALTGLTQSSLVIVQQWRGTASHFNMFTTDTNAAIALVIAATTLPVTALFAVITWHSFSHIVASPARRLAIRFGMTLVSLGTLQGLTMIAHAVSTVPTRISAHPHPPYTFGAEGVMLISHLIALHGLLVMMLLLSSLHLGRQTEERQVWIVQLGALGYGSLWVVSTLETYSGHAPLGLGLTSLLLWGLPLATLTLAFGLALRPGGRAAMSADGGA